MKGARNYTDLNRISGNIAFVRDMLTELGYAIPAITSRDDWLKEDFPRESDITKLKADVAAIRATGIVSPQTPLTPDLPYTHYQKINDIEKIIFDIESALRRAEKISYNAGAFYAHAGLGFYFGKSATIPLPEYPVIITDVFPVGMVGDEYTYQIEFISTSLLGVVFEIIDGELPQGLTLSDEGAISGRPLTTSDSTFTIRVTNIAGYDTKDFNILIETYNTNLRAGSPFAYSGLGFYFGGS